MSLANMPGKPKATKAAGRRVASRAQIALRRTRAIEMRTRGESWQAIADALGYGSRGDACKDVSRALHERTEAQQDAADTYREIEIERIDALWRKAWEVLEAEVPTVSHGRVVQVEDEETGRKVTVPDHDHVLRVIETLRKLSESRRKLLGLDSATKVDGGVTVRYEITGVNLEALR